MLLPPWMLWFNSTAGSRRSLRREWSGPHTGETSASDASFAGTRRWPSERSFTDGRATEQTAGSRAGHRINP
jgi:hypothetical protein